MSTFQEYAYQTGELLRNYVDENFLPSGDSLTRIEQKLDAALTSAASTKAASVVLTHKVVSTTETTDSLANLRGMDCNTGKLLKGVEYLQQRIVDALMTPKGTQVLLRARGSTYPDLIDDPGNQSGYLRIVAAAAAVFRDPLCGVPDFNLKNVFIHRGSENDAKPHSITLVGDWLGQPVEVSV